MKFKDFYLKVKIANIRKRLTENESLNRELCLDRKTHPELINVKIMVKALEEIAEEEQKKIIEEEKAEAEKREKERSSALSGTMGSDVETPRSDKEIEKKDKKERDAEEEKPEKKEERKEPRKDDSKTGGPYGMDSIKFGNAMIKGKGAQGSHSPLLAAGFNHLNTIEEEK